MARNTEIAALRAKESAPPLTDEAQDDLRTAVTVTRTHRKDIGIRHIDGPLGVRGRNSDNRLIRETLHWTPSRSLRAGLEQTYRWIESQVLREAA